MSNEVRLVDRKALLKETGRPQVYVDPRTGTVSDKPTRDSVAIDSTIWWGANAAGGEPSSPVFSNSEVRKRIRLEAAEMAVYFPDFSLHSNGTTFWQGEIEGMGEVKVTYPQTYPAQRFTVEVIGLEGAFNESLRQLVWSYDGITPAGAVIVTMRMFLRDKVAMR